MIKLETDDITIYTTTVKQGNMAIHTNDCKESVINNRLNFFESINKKPFHFAFANPSHTTNLIEMSALDREMGVFELSKYDNYDALYTKEPDLFVGIFHADCTPVLLHAVDKKIVCAIHSGFKGSVDGIVITTIQALIDNEGIDPKNLFVYIMPSITQQNYEISKEMAMYAMPTNALIQKDEDHYLFDNHLFIKEQLATFKIPIHQIIVTSICTFKSPLFFSYRENKTNKRNMSIIALKK